MTIPEYQEYQRKELEQYGITEPSSGGGKDEGDGVGS